jgi:hypothetical protein
MIALLLDNLVQNGPTNGPTAWQLHDNNDVNHAWRKEIEYCEIWPRTEETGP